MRRGRIDRAFIVLNKGQWLALILFIALGVFHNFIANDKYLCSIDDGKISFFKSTDSAKNGLRVIIPYSYSTIDKKNIAVSPFERQNVKSLYYRHWFGTDSLGRDVLAGFLHGCHIALVVGVCASLLSLILGLILGFLSGYYGDHGLRVRKLAFYPLLFISLLAFFYLIYLPVHYKLIILFLMVVLWVLMINEKKAVHRKSVSIPMDMLIFRLIDIIHSIPALFLILIVLVLFEKASVWNVILVIALFRWPVITRHLRAEILKLKQENYIEASKAIGLSDLRVFNRHILPMALSPIIIVMSFGFASAILLESTLSFLGIGVSVDQVSWGSIIREARFDFKSWWLALFPGLGIYAIVVLFNSIGNRLNEYLQARN